MKKILSIGLVVIMSLMMVTMASAHMAKTFDPMDKNCMGKLTSFHAQDPANGVVHSFAPHKGIADAMGVEPATDFQEFMKLNKAWCKSGMSIE